MGKLLRIAAYFENKHDGWEDFLKLHYADNKETVPYDIVEISDKDAFISRYAIAKSDILITDVPKHFEQIETVTASIPIVIHVKEGETMSDLIKFFGGCSLPKFVH